MLISLPPIQRATGIRLLIAGVLFSFAAQLSAQSTNITKIWDYVPQGRDPGVGGFAVGDFDNDGAIEVATVNRQGGDYVALLEYQPASGALKNVAQLGPFAPNSLTGAGRFDRPQPDGAVIHTIVNEVSGARLLRIAVSPLRVVGSVVLDAFFVSAPVFADVDADGRLDIVCTRNYSTIALLDATTGALKWQVPGNAPSYAVGQLDDDAKLEIVVVRTPGLVLDGALGKVQFEEPMGFGRYAAIGNLDGDAVQEFAVAPFPNSGNPRVYDTNPIAPAWTVPVNSSSGIAISDVIGDTGQELLVTSRPLVSSQQSIIAYDPVTHLQVGLIEPQGSADGLSTIGRADFGGASNPQFVFGWGLASTGADRLELATFAAPGRTTWSDAEEEGPYLLVGAADVDADGAIEEVVASQRTQASPASNLSIVDRATRNVEFRAPLLIDPIAQQPFGLLPNSGALAQLDGDAALEIIVGGASPFYTHSSQIAVLDGVTRQVERVWDPGNMPALTNKEPFDLKVRDVDGDGDLDFAFISRDGVRAPAAICVVDTNSGATLWQSPPLGMYPADYELPPSLIVDNLDGDPAIELAMGTNDGLVVYDGVTHALEWSLPIPASALVVLRPAGGPAELALVTRNNIFPFTYSLVLLNLATRQERLRVPLPSSTSWALAAGSDSYRQLWFAYDDNVVLLRVSDGAELARFPFYGSNRNLRTEIAAQPGALEVTVGGASGVARLHVDEPALFNNGFE